MRDTVVVAGALANKPFNGGEAWVRLSWVRGLQRLGFHVELVEEIDARTLRSDGEPSGLPESRQADYFQRVTTAFGLADAATLVLADGTATVGRSRAELEALARRSVLLVNISGNLAADWLRPLFRRSAYIDIDPGFTQFWLDQGVAGHRLDGHDQYYTIAENIGTPGCSIPTGGLTWRTVRQPVVLEDWPVMEAPDPSRFTTVSSWRGSFGRIEHQGRLFGLKAHEFRKLRALPGLVPEELEIALDIHPDDGADLRALRAEGWRVVDPRRVVPDPHAFRDYVLGSAGELSVAQGVYVDTASGWFSDRTARYLAAGRPVVVQDTGFGANLPTGKGLLAFRTLDDAVSALAAIREDYGAHARAARAIAEEHFDSDAVLEAFMEEALSDGPVTAQAVADTGGDESAPAPTRSRGTTPRSPGRLRILVAGRLAAAPGQGGAAWAVLQYLLGLRDLGHEVRFVEPLDGTDLDPAGAPLASSRQAAYLRDVATAFGLEGSSALWTPTGEAFGATAEQVRRWARESDLLINLSGVLTDPALLEPVPLRLYLDMDPAFTQLWHEMDGIDMGLGGHTHHATVGLALAAGDTTLPGCGVDWIATLPPVVMDAWPRAERVAYDGATTVANWRSYGSIEHDGVLYGQKAHSLRRLVGLPRRVATPLALALSIHPDERDDLAALREHGWDLLDPLTVAGSPAGYADFVRGSAMELGVAKSGYVDSGSGWFSDRSACYLASGRPVLAQETGFSRHLPTGRGLLAFETEEDAASGLDEVRSDYSRHARWARELAGDVFDSRKTLARLLETVGGSS